jgi:hypothetical protein
VKASFVAIYDRGLLASERFHFQMTVDLNLSFLVLLDTVYSNPTGIDAGNKLAYWFPPKLVKAGEHIVVYSRAGVVSAELKNGINYHFVFRGLATPVYANPNACGVIMELQTWTTSPKLPG